MKILDSSVIILFLNDIEEEECLHMLSEIGEILLIPESVYEEISDKNTRLKMDSLISRTILRKIEELKSKKEELMRRRFPTLGKGEINVLAWGKSLKSQGEKFWCVIDEIPGRNAAKKVGLPLTGSIGLIKILKGKKILNKDKLKDIVDKIKGSPFWIDEKILGGLLDE
jgi:predicted nucleic acid-binding protein